MTNLFEKDACLTGIHLYQIAQSAGAVEYTDCFSAEGVRPPL